MSVVQAFAYTREYNVGLTVLGLNQLFDHIKPLILAYPDFKNQFVSSAL